MSERDAERSVSQTVRAQLALRDMILSAQLRPGERISELQAVEITGVSRTPVRLALVRLEDEGLLQAIPSGGFMVKAFTERDILDSIELRGTLEGLAARFAAERGVSARSLEPLKECLGDLDQLVRQDPISVEAFSAYVTMNARFHALLSAFKAETGCPVLVNTSFNVRGEPIVCTPEDAFRCLMGTELHAIAVGNLYLTKDMQDASLKRDYTRDFELD